jgi:hypothetical protein
VKQYEPKAEYGSPYKMSNQELGMSLEKIQGEDIEIVGYKN